MPKKEMTKDQLIKLLTFFTKEISNVHEKLDSIVERIEPGDLPEEFDIQNPHGDDIPFPVETLVEMEKYLGKVPFFIGIT
tara:strand:+ start:219 stop:458 length:240 start_codon:yes stop_codon:yes gene_type:complete